MNRHWSERYLFIEARDGYDCADFVTQIMREVFRTDVNLPQHAASIRARDAQIDAWRSILAERTNQPIEGDAVLMKTRGRKIGVGHHLGVYAAPGGRAAVVHLLKGVGARLHCLPQLATVNLDIEGFYRWRTMI